MASFRRSNLEPMVCRSVILALVINGAFAQTSNLLGASKYCSNRGGSGGSNSMSVNVGGSNLAACTAAVAANSMCGSFFSYGIVDGFCDCVPCGETSCTQQAFANYNAYSIETSYQACPALAGTSIALAALSFPVESTTPAEITFGFTTTNELLASDTITVAASSPVFASTGAVSCTVKIGGTPDAATFASSPTASGTSTLTASVQSGRTVGSGVEVKLSCTSNLAQFAANGASVTFTFTCARHLAAAGVTGWTTVTAASVAGDPVTWYGSRRAEFKLPMSRLTTMLRTPDMAVLAAPFETGKEQWIGRVVIKSSRTNSTFLQIDVNRKLAEEGGQTMFVMASPDSNQRGSVEPFAGAADVFLHDHEIISPEGLVMHYGRQQNCKGPCREVVVVLGSHAKIMIHSASAAEFYGQSSVEALKSAHLDIDVFDMIEPSTFQGTLPELWGLQEMSEETQNMLVPDGLLDLATNSSVLVNHTKASVRSTEADMTCADTAVL